MTDIKQLKSKIEAILYCNPKGIETKKLAKLCSIGSVGHIKSILHSLREDYEKRDSGIRVIDCNGTWRFEILPDHTELVTESAKPEIDKAILQTLAFIAHKKNAKQSDIVKVRSNKAYDHIKYLQDTEFIESKKKGTTKVLTPTKKFYAYFNLKVGENLELED